ncbi:hypothetical protein CFC21_082378 [Triticum aestivum]|uniref:Bifunctional inhibitor/plant lipid transfer protein/seed storage helical domain-containing protein n=2 Tax=Triticum aestivum TaxID=4565 RepID=A0A9R1I6B5_WHEAT|nr:uncharacterized protein LOC119318915 [Triticum dicoccoides]XP_044406165.1 uncharacterized protein LOC123130304 [Triticum aestivum]KAF7077871.1 hypothetical protein CFC21_082378 [Triticum aestivum]
MASSSKACAAALLLLLALAVATAAGASKRSIASEANPRPVGKVIVTEPPVPTSAPASAAKWSIASEANPRPVGKVIVTEPPVPTSAPASAAKRSIASEANPRPVAKVIVTEPPVPTSAVVDVSATCMGSLLELSPCLAFFRDAGTSKAPAGCCKGLGSIVRDQPACLCYIFNRTLERAIGVDIPVDRALALMGDVCGLTLPQDLMSSCGDNGGVPPLYVCPAPSA